MRLRKIRVEKISLFHLKKSAVNYFCLLPVMFQGQPEVSSIMRELAGRSLTGTYLYSLCVKPDTSTTSASKRSHC